MKSLDQEWDDFMNYNESSCLDDIEDIEDIEDIVEKQSNSIIMNSSKSSIEIPKCSDIYISTKTKIAFLNRPVKISYKVINRSVILSNALKGFSFCIL